MPRPEVYNIELYDRNTEYRLQVPGGIKKMMVKCRADNDLRMAFSQGGTADSFISIPCGSSYTDDDIPVTVPGFEIPVNFYFRAPDADFQVAEVMIWR